MEGFSAGWLSLREPADHAARSRPLTSEAIEALPVGGALRILDLAAGTGSNFRYLTAAGLGETGRAEFLLVDHDPALLATVATTSNVATR
ncbi:MAG: class I SAM-dependent methyltransferase, partial [Vicinamibacterales bacterium]